MKASAFEDFCLFVMQVWVMTSHIKARAFIRFLMSHDKRPYLTLHFLWNARFFSAYTTLSRFGSVRLPPCQPRLRPADSLAIRPYLNHNFVIAELSRVKRASGAPLVRFFGKAINARYFGYDVTYFRPYRL